MIPIRPVMVAVLLLPTLALAGSDLVVTQDNKQFSVTNLSIERGQSITFVNNDRVRHNIALRTPDGQDQTGVVQAPGESNKLTFDSSGRYQVHCLIHPMMRLSVDVR